MRKLFVSLLITILMVGAIALTAGAANLSAKQLVINQIVNYEPGFNKEIYNKSTGEAKYQITRLEGELAQDLKLWQESSLILNNQLDTAGKKSNFDFSFNSPQQSYTGEFYISGSQIIITKSILQMINQIAPQPELGNLDNYPDYVYFSNEEIQNLWQALGQYRNQSLPPQYKDLLVFIVEAIPDQYFTASVNGVALQLDQAGFEDVIYRLIIKISNEKERFAAIATDLATMYNQDPQLKAEIKSNITKDISKYTSSGNLPTREQIHLLSQFCQVQELSYSVSLLPGGPKVFKLSLNLTSPDGMRGDLDLTSKSEGQKNNVKGNMNATVDFADSDGTAVNGTLTSSYQYGADNAVSKVIFAVKAVQKSTEQIMLDFELTCDSSQKAESGLVVTMPVLNASNSRDITDLISLISSADDSSSSDKLQMYVNGKKVKANVQPFLQDGKRAMVPVRFVAEELGCQVTWIAPGEVRISRGQDLVTMYVGKTNYLLNGRNATMDAKPVIVEGRVFVPLRAVAQGLQCDVNWVEPNSIMINQK